MFGLDIGTDFGQTSLASTGKNTDNLVIDETIAPIEIGQESTTIIDEIEIKSPKSDYSSDKKSPKGSTTAFPLLTTQFYSIYNILYGVVDSDFENALISNTIMSLTKSRVDTIKFSFPNMDEEIHEKYSCAHDLLMRIDHLFRFMVKHVPKVRKNLPQQAVAQAINFLHKYFVAMLDSSEKWIEAYAGHFALRLSVFANAPRNIPIERINLYLEWLCYLWAVMEFYAVQFERHFYGAEKDKSNPFHPQFEPPQNVFRPFQCASRLIDSVYKPQQSPTTLNNTEGAFIMRQSLTSGRDSGFADELNGCENNRNFVNFNLIINFTSS